MDIREAAQARGAAVNARADRPSQRRSRTPMGEELRGWTSGVRSRIEIREPNAAGGPLAFEGYASVTGVGYEMYDFFGPYTEVVEQGAFGASLNRADLDVPLVLGHDSMRRIARTTNGTLSLEEDDSGLHVRAPELDPSDADVQYVVPKLRGGLLDEMSFMFRITDGEWSPDWTEFHIRSVDIHRGDVSIVGYGANPNTKGSGLVSQPDVPAFLAALSPEKREQARAWLREERAARKVPIHDLDTAHRI